MRASDALVEDPEILQLYPSIDLGSAGPEEMAIYSGVVAGYFLGGALTAKGVTKFQELRENDFKYTRPVNKSIQRMEDLLSSETKEGEEKVEEVLDCFFEDED